MSKKWSEAEKEMLLELYNDNTYKQIASKLNKAFGTKHSPNAVRKAYERFKYPVLAIKDRKDAPKILFFDIETVPVTAYVWGLWNNNVGLNMIESDWHVLSWAAKWYGEDDVMYADQRNAKNFEDDRKILIKIWKLLDEADIVIGQNSKKFDTKKLNARFIQHGMQPPSSYRQIDTLLIAKRHFGFTSNKLEYMTDKLCTKYKKSGHAKFPGFKMWSECMKGNIAAYNEMEEYNKLDVLSLEELYEILIPWDDTINFAMYFEDDICSCGSSDFKKAGFYYTNASKFQKYKCKNCGAEYRDVKKVKSAGSKFRKNQR
jgi:uncharacterized protein YprB with RNaseH-like and TPR domain